MNKKIIVVGSSNTDMVVKVPHIPAPGETVMGSELLTIPGGKGANQAVGAARAGGDVVFIACVSDDTFGTDAIENYKKDKIDTSFIKVKPGLHSGVALINVAEDGENSIAVAPGANSHLLPEDIIKARDAFAGAGAVLVQLEIPQETVLAVVQLASELDVPVILNPAPGAKLPAKLLKMVSVITPNETEAALLTGTREINEDTIPEMARELYDMGIETVIITLGSKGVYLLNSDFQGVIQGYKVKAVDTTAAGDVFNGALASALSANKPVREAIDFAQRAAAISVTRMGAQPSAPHLQEILDHKF
ncbi:MAG: ribokinase [Marinilabiliales bacterium]|nr:MAG: ribokinase [Marinilabiliales bacterium]